MSRDELIEYALQSDIMKKWHYFQFHFSFYHKEIEHELCKSIINSCISCELKIEGIAKNFIDRIASINGRVKQQSDYEQLLQILAELLIVEKTLSFEWENVREYKHEPTTGESKKNPEVNIVTDNYTIGVEVKSPKIIDHMNIRASNPFQLPARSPIIDFYGKEHTTLPRDNPVKDFLISADTKFKSFKETIPNYYGVLVIVWDDYIYEPISSLLSEGSGLFTEASFYIDTDKNAVKFPNIDCVVLTRHLLQIIRGTRGEPLPDEVKTPLEYGDKTVFPFKVHIVNPASSVTIPDEVMQCFQTHEPSFMLGAEYSPTDQITWFN